MLCIDDLSGLGYLPPALLRQGSANRVQLLYRSSSMPFSSCLHLTCVSFKQCGLRISSFQSQPLPAMVVHWRSLAELISCPSSSFSHRLSLKPPALILHPFLHPLALRPWVSQYQHFAAHSDPHLLQAVLPSHALTFPSC